MREVLEEGARDVRLIGPVAEPGALNCLHAEAAGSLKFVGTAVADVKAFFGGDAQRLYGPLVDFGVRL